MRKPPLHRIRIRTKEVKREDIYNEEVEENEEVGEKRGRRGRGPSLTTEMSDRHFCLAIAAKA